jgi:hypothetical protein
MVGMERQDIQIRGATRSERHGRSGKVREAQQ